MLGAQALRSKQRWEEKERKERQKRQQHQKKDQKSPKTSSASFSSLLKVSEFENSDERKKATSQLDLSKLDCDNGDSNVQRRHSQGAQLDTDKDNQLRVPDT